MSRRLENNVEALERKAQRKVAVIRRVVYEYNQRLDATHNEQAGPVVSKQHEMERMLGDYIKLYKTIKRTRKKLQARVA